MTKNCLSWMAVVAILATFWTGQDALFAIPGHRIAERIFPAISSRRRMEGIAQLRAVQRAEEEGAQIVTIWNKSHREHTIIGTGPGDSRRAPDGAVRASGGKRSYCLDADHIGLWSVDRFIAPYDFFTIEWPTSSPSPRCARQRKHSSDRAAQPPSRSGSQGPASLRSGPFCLSRTGLFS